MPMPSLKDLIDAAAYLYCEIRKPKEASYIHSLATSAASLVGYNDSSSDKKNALAELTALKLGSLPIIEQNSIFTSGIMKLLQHKHINDGSCFKTLVEILAGCAEFLDYNQSNSSLENYIGLKPQLALLAKEVAPTVSNFFEQTITTFLSGVEKYRIECLNNDYDKSITEAQLEITQLQEKLQALEGEIPEHPVTVKPQENELKKLDEMHCTKARLRNLERHETQQRFASFYSGIGLYSTVNKSETVQNKVKESHSLNNLRNVV